MADSSALIGKTFSIERLSRMAEKTYSFLPHCQSHGFFCNFCNYRGSWCQNSQQKTFTTTFWSSNLQPSLFNMQNASSSRLWSNIAVRQTLNTALLSALISKCKETQRSTSHLRFPAVKFTMLIALLASRGSGKNSCNEVTPARVSSWPFSRTSGRKKGASGANSCSEWIARHNGVDSGRPEADKRWHQQPRPLVLQSPDTPQRRAKAGGYKKEASAAWWGSLCATKGEDVPTSVWDYRTKLNVFLFISLLVN